MPHITVGAPPVFFAPRRRGGLWHAVAWLGALLFALRAFLPMGFMPDPDALRAGRFQIIYCSAAGPMPPGMAMAGHRIAGSPPSMDDGHSVRADDAGLAAMPGVASADPRMVDAQHTVAANYHAGHALDMPGQDQPQGGSGMPADCPFGLTGAYTYSPPVFAVAAPGLALAWHVPVPPPSTPPLPGIVAGPPVGSRAPPISLA